MTDLTFHGNNYSKYLLDSTEMYIIHIVGSLVDTNDWNILFFLYMYVYREYLSDRTEMFWSKSIVRYDWNIPLQGDYFGHVYFDREYFVR